VNIGFLASGKGSNVRAVVEACQSGRIAGQPRVIISNNSTAGVLEFAKVQQIPSFHLSSLTHPDNLDQTIVQTLRQHGVELVVLGGYMKKLSNKTLAAYAGRIINIHPALLPKFGGQGMYGLNVHKAVIAAGESETGATVHLVDGEYDHGATLAQARVPVLPGDTPEMLAARVLAVEHELLVDAVARLCGEG
jgi:phosphoribosylglycinamide formyltransferase-1